MTEQLTEADLSAMLRSGEWEVVSPPNAFIVDGQLQITVATASDPVVTVTTMEVLR